MQELLDENLQEQHPPWWNAYSLFFYWKVYVPSFLVAMVVLLLFFIRHDVVTDLDALMFLIILWGTMLNLFQQASNSFFIGFLLSMFLIFFVFLNYVNYPTAWIHEINPGGVTHWDWQHYEFKFGRNIYILNLNGIFRSFFLFTRLLESFEWLVFYAFLTIFTTELLHLYTIYKTKYIVK